jgi:hypothetical protein
MSHFRKVWPAAALAAAALAACCARAAEVDRYLPADTKAVVVINVRQTLDAPLVKKHALEQIKTALEQNAELQKIIVAAGVDPLKDISSVTLAVTGSLTDADKGLLIVHGTFNVAKAQAAAEDFAQKNPTQLKVEKEDGLVLYSNTAGRKTFYAAFADKSTAVLSATKETVVAAARSAGQKPPALNKDMQAVLDKADATQVIWLAALVPAELQKMLAKGENTKDIADKLSAFTGSVNLDKDLQAAFHVWTTDAKTADSVQELLDGIKGFARFMAQQNAQAGPVLGDVVDSIKITTEKSRVDLTLKVTEDMLEKGLKQLPGREQPKKP